MLLQKMKKVLLALTLLTAMSGQSIAVGASSATVANKIVKEGFSYVAEVLGLAGVNPAKANEVVEVLEKTVKALNGGKLPKAELEYKKLFKDNPALKKSKFIFSLDDAHFKEGTIKEIKELDESNPKVMIADLIQEFSEAANTSLKFSGKEELSACTSCVSKFISTLGVKTLAVPVEAGSTVARFIKQARVMGPAKALSKVKQMMNKTLKMSYADSVAFKKRLGKSYVNTFYAYLKLMKGGSPGQIAFGKSLKAHCTRGTKTFFANNCFKLFKILLDNEGIGQWTKRLEFISTTPGDPSTGAKIKNLFKRQAAEDEALLPHYKDLDKKLCYWMPGA